MSRQSQNVLGDAIQMINHMGNVNNEERIENNRQMNSNIHNKGKNVSSKYKRLSKYRWGIGLEHEVQLFHNPYSKRNKTNVDSDVSNTRISDNIDSITEFIVYNSLDPTIQLLEKSSNYDKLTQDDRQFLDNIPFEASGRKCSGEHVLEKVPVGMPEFVTVDPFSSLDRKPKCMEDYCDQILNQEKRFINIILMNELAKKQIYKYGDLMAFPFGMSNYIKVPTESSSKTEVYKYKKKLYEDYTGSYHVTLTLPYDKNKSDDRKYKKEFIRMHQQFANQFQWLEPLLIAGYFSSDMKSMGTVDTRIRGSFRLMRTGWGNLATSNVRKFKDGIGRYADINAHWRQGLNFKDIEKLQYCNKVSIPEPGAVSALGANFRTFGSTDPLRPWHRESGVGMTIPNGIEIRIFDHFPSKYLKSLCRIIIYIAENSRIHTTNKYVYKNKFWIEAIQKIMMEGWRAILPIGYIKELRKNLNLKIETKSLIAYDILETVNLELFKKHNDGDYPHMMLRKYTKNKPPKIPNINRYSWEYGLLIKLNRDKQFTKKFKLVLKKLPKNQTITLDIFSELFFNIFDKKLWVNNIEDIMYFLQTYKVLDKNRKLKHTNINKFFDELSNNLSNFFLDVGITYPKHILKNIGFKIKSNL
jgi:hypothetical protein